MFARAGGSRRAAKLSRCRRTRRGGQLPQWERVYQHKVTKRRSWATQLIDSIGCLLARSGSILTGIRGFAPALGASPTRSHQRHRDTFASWRRHRFFGTSGRNYCLGRRLVLGCGTRRRCRNFRQPIRNDLDKCAERQLTIKSSHIARFHPNATVACRSPDCFFLRRAMNVNASVKGMYIGSLETTQPDDAGDDGITTRRVWKENFSRETTIMKNCSGRCVVTDFLRDLQEPKRSCHSAPTIAEPEL